ncbi:MAG TPA: HAMP domain-containing sensor histidine kinase [Actinocrinis sp.]|nr:HAMP domain-containing sensor histidine kinase [Actinocrinis sp.]
MQDKLLIMLISGGCAAAVCLCGLVALRLQTGRAVTPKLFTVITAIVLAMAAGAIGTMQATFLTQHDCGVVMVLCVAVAVCAGALGVPLARSITADSSALGEALRALTDAGTGPAGTGPGLATAELEQVRRLLADTSQRLAASRERERALARSRRELVAWVSHDLRAPLAGLRAMAIALEEDAATDPERLHAQMRSSVDRLSSTVDDLVEMSSAHAGALRMSLAGVPLADLVDRAVLAGSSLAHARRVALAADVRTPVGVRVDAREMGRALDGLLENTIRHVPPHGAVRIEAGEQDGSALLVVTDTCGSTVHGGTADYGHAIHSPSPLGGGVRWLTVVRGIVEAHSGEVAVHDVVDGCRIEIRLPLPAGPTEPERTTPVYPEPKYPEAERTEAMRTVVPARTDRPDLASLPAQPDRPAQLDQPDQSDRLVWSTRSGRPALTLPRRRRTP